MSVFSTNQNRQFYVISDVVSYDASASVDVDDSSDAGKVQVRVIDNGIDKEFYFLVKGADTVLKSDRIPVKNLSYAKAVSAEKLRTPLKSVLVSLNANVNGGVPVVGQDYILRINFRQFYGMSDQDQYFKDVAVRATSSTTPDAASFYKELVKALNLSFARELGATKDSNPYLTFEAQDDGVLITEKEQSWHLGTEAQEPVIFDIFPTTIYVDGVDEIWATVETQDADTTTEGMYIKNGKKIADLEWFCMGERGDQYRQIGWPNNIDTHYLVDPTKEYDVLELHYAFTDDGISSYRSEKDITFVYPTDGVVGQTTVVGIDALIQAINAATGLTLKTASESEAATTADSSTDKAVVDEDADVVTTEETSEEKAVVDGAEETTEATESTETTEGTETVTA